ncbi:MAG: hypothetical protein ABJZ83_05305 [Yoonia sp.]|uniref:hypothetical protein n=1 Tax=Yoonia sp. TaxID=2212373 RepID=UPI003263B951
MLGLKWSAIVALSAVVTLGACEQIKDANRAGLQRDREIVRERQRISREIDALARGKATLAACIEARCRELNLDGMRLDDFSVINGLTHVTTLMMSRTNFDDLSDIKDLGHLKELHITSTDITDLEGLVYFPQLDVLHVEGTSPAVDKSPIAQLAGLSDLAMGNVGKGFDASFIQDMLLLEDLSISWHGSEADISVLRGHPTLKNVDIGGELPDDQSVLLTMPKLEAIMFYRADMLNDNVRDALNARGLLQLLPAVIVC